MKQHLRTFMLSASLLCATTSMAAATANNNASNNASLSQFNPSQQQQLKTYINQAIPAYLLNNPEILMQTAQKLRATMQKKQMSEGVSAAHNNIAALLHDPNTPTVDQQGPITLVQFFDYQCSACAQMYTRVDQLKKQHPKLRLVFKDLPIFGGASITAAKAGMAAYRQGGGATYMRFHDAMYQANLLEGKLKDKDVYRIAASIKLNMKKLKKDMKDPALDQQIKSNMKLAQALKLRGTPAFIIAPTNIKDPNLTQKITFIPGGTSQSVLNTAISKANAS